MIQFASYAVVEIPLTVVDSPATAALICADIDAIAQTYGGTKMRPGLDVAYDMFLNDAAGAYRSLSITTDDGVFDESSSEARCGDLRTMTVPVKICTGLVDLPCPRFDAFLMNCANVPGAATYDPGQPEGVYHCVDDLDTFDVFCDECSCAIVYAGEEDCDGNGVPDVCEDVVCGACCDDEAWECNTRAAEDCPWPLRFEEGVQCEDLDPQCGQAWGACCFKDGSCEDWWGPSDCQNYEGEWQGWLITCDPDPCGQPHECPGDTISSNPLGGFVSSAVTSDEGAGYSVATRIGSCGNYCDAHWWGIHAYFDPTQGWLPCDKLDDSFNLRFFRDGARPGVLEHEYLDVTPTRTDTGMTFGDYPIYYYSVDELDPCTVLQNGYFSVQGVDHGEGCWFLWLDGAVDLNSYRCDGEYWSELDNGFAFCLTGPDPIVLGACCYEITADCVTSELSVCDLPQYRFEPYTACESGPNCCFCQNFDPPASDCTAGSFDEQHCLEVLGAGWDDCEFHEDAGCMPTLSGGEVCAPALDPPCGVIVPSLGACCFGDGACEELTSDDCASAGGTWKGADSACEFCNPCTPPAPVCPEDSIFSQKYYGSDAALTSDESISTLAADDFYELTEPIGDVHWWGMNACIGGGGGGIEPVHGQGREATDEQFHIRFYLDDEGLPGAIAASYMNLSVTRERTSYYVYGTRVWAYAVDLPYPCFLPNGWISIQRANQGQVCPFHWMMSYDGNDNAQHSSGPLNWDHEPVPNGGTYRGLAFCLTPGAQGVTGACCDDSTGSCTSPVLAENCAFPSRFAPNTLCAELEPPCGCLDNPQFIPYPPNGTVDARRGRPAASLQPCYGIGMPDDPATALDESAVTPIVVDLGCAGGGRVECWELCETVPEPPPADDPRCLCDEGPNSIQSVTDNLDGTYTLILAQGIRADAVTTIRYRGGTGNDFVEYAAHPGNVDASDFANATDIIEVVNCLNSPGSCELWRADIDWSGAITTNDIIEEINLLNGSGTYCSWYDTPHPINHGTCP